MNMECKPYHEGICPKCKGTGMGDMLKPCEVCRGSGWIEPAGMCQMSQEAMGFKDATPPCMSAKALGNVMEKVKAMETANYMTAEINGLQDVVRTITAKERKRKSILPTDSAERKTFPMYEGLLKYFPDALAAVSQLSWTGNQKHNPGEPLHWAKEKSTDHQDCVLRHMVDALKAEESGNETLQELELTSEAWRALAALQTFFDKRWGNQ